VSNTLLSHAGTGSASPETEITTAIASGTGNGTASTENGIDATMTITTANRAIETLVIEGRATCEILESPSTVSGNENTETPGTEICEIYGTYGTLAT
jgi:hypothetical protein